MGLFGPKRHTDRTGDVSEAAIITRLLQAGYVVLTPYAKQHRYDLVIEDADGRFWHMQCKTAWVEQDGVSLRFNASSNHYSYVNRKSMSDGRLTMSYRYRFRDLTPRLPHPECGSLFPEL